MTRLLTITCILTLLSFGAFSQSAAREKAMGYLMEGDNYLRQGNWEDALFAYTNAINTDQTYAAAYMKRARLYEGLNRYKDAEIDFNYAIRLNPYSELFYDSRAIVKMLDMDYEGADTDFEQALMLNPKNTEVRSHRIENYIAFQQYEKALKEIDSLEGHGVKRENLLEKKALVCYLKKDFECSNLYADSLLTLKKLSSTAYDIKGLILLEQGFANQSIEYFTWAIEENPNFYMAYYNRGLAYKKLEKDKQAIEDFNKAIELNKGIDNVFLARARSKKRLGDTEGALQDYTRSIKNADKEKAIALYDRTFVNKILGNYEEALEDAKALVELDPDNHLYWNALGNVYLLYGDYFEAIENYTEAISLDMDFGKAYYNRGLAYIMTNQSRQGCLDLSYSSQLGNKKALEMIQYLCGN